MHVCVHITYSVWVCTRLAEGHFSRVLLQGEAGHYGAYHCDLPKVTLDLLSEAIANLHPAPDFIIYTGTHPSLVYTGGPCLTLITPCFIPALSVACLLLVPLINLRAGLPFFNWAL